MGNESDVSFRENENLFYKHLVWLWMHLLHCILKEFKFNMWFDLTAKPQNVLPALLHFVLSWTWCPPAPIHNSKREFFDFSVILISRRNLGGGLKSTSICTFGRGSRVENECLDFFKLRLWGRTNCFLLVFLQTNDTSLCLILVIPQQNLIKIMIIVLN